MEIPSLLYIQALAERIDLLTSYIKDTDQYQWLIANQCVFIDGFILVDRKTKSQFEFNTYHLKTENIKNWERMQLVISNYTELIAQIHKLDRQTGCIRKFKDIQLLREACYRQLIRERVYANLPLYWHNMNGYWKIVFNRFDLPWGYYDVYKLTDKKPSETGKSRLERMHLFLTEDDMRKDRYNVMHCEELFDSYRKELQKTKKIIL